MRWISFFILGYIAVGLQIGMARSAEWHGAEPDLILLAAIFVALNASRDAALLACLMLGAMHDLTAQGTLGLYALAYGLVGMFVLSARQALFREHPLTHIVTTFFSGLIVAFVLLMHLILRPLPGERAAGMHGRIGPLVMGAIYTAVLSLPVLGFLQRIKGLFLFQSSLGRARHTSR